MKSETSIPEHVSEEETLGRSIASTRGERSARQGVIIPTVFLDRRPTRLSLSVDRMDHASRSKVAGIAADRETRRVPPRTFRGWALIAAEDASDSGRAVEASPKNGSPFHADIRLNITEPNSDKLLIRKKEHAQELASRSTWEEAPEQRRVG